ncbi:hypothetical protein BH09PLA1_BH09PLA1_30950 [soil metagenome]
MPGRIRRAFTLAETIVVIGIIVLLLAALLPMVNRARLSAKRARMAMDLTTIGIGLDAYHDDFGDYPRPAEHDYVSKQRGAEALCRAMLAPDGADGSYADGADGFGFRTRRVDNVPQGRVYGPYLRPETFKIRRNPPSPGPSNIQPYYMVDLDDQPILYYVARSSKPNIHLPDSFVALSATPPPSPLFNVIDNSGPYPDGLYRMRLMLGDVSLDGAIDGDETPASTGPYLLWCAGPDGAYGPIPDPRPLTPAQRRTLRSKVDDVTNFPFR